MKLTLAVKKPRGAMGFARRYTCDTYDTIRYEVTLEDPDVFTKPWHMQ